MAFTFEEFPWTRYYDSDLREILKYMKKFQEELESYAEIIDTLSEAIKDIDGIKSDVTTLKSNVGALLLSVDSIVSRLSSLENLHDADIKYLQQQIDALTQEIENLDISWLKNYVDNRNKEIIIDYNNKFYEVYLKMYELFYGLTNRLIKLAEIVNSLDTSAYNPWCRRIAKESVQQNLLYGYHDLADMELTAQQYSELGLSADDYNVYNFTAYEYSVRGKRWFRLNFVYSPTYGFKQDISNVLTSIVNWFCGTISAEEYSVKDLTADEYTELGLSADEYYSYDSMNGYLRLGGNGLTASQYSTITT